MQTEKPVSWVNMADNEDWVLRPALEKMCLYESLIDGTLGLEDVARMNDALDVRYENELRYRKANQ